MKLSGLLASAVLAVYAPVAAAASGWGFTDASLNVQSKGSGVGGGIKEKFTDAGVLSKAVSFGASDILKVLITTQDGSTAKRPHQAFLNLQDPVSGLETSFPFSVKDTGKAKLELAHKDVPIPLLQARKPLVASIVIGSFGASKPFDKKAFDLEISLDTTSPASAGTDPPLRYSKLPEIRHIFKKDPSSPPLIVTLIFLGGVLAALPALFGAWLFLGGNANHVTKAMQDAPVAHVLFYGSIAAMEGVFFLYYTTWNLFRILPLAAGIGAIIFLSGTRALTEVQNRRLAGLR